MKVEFVEYAMNSFLTSRWWCFFFFFGFFYMSIVNSEMYCLQLKRSSWSHWEKIVRLINKHINASGFIMPSVTN